jgi:hypothetical protein
VDLPPEEDGEEKTEKSRTKEKQKQQTREERSFGEVCGWRFDYR